MVNAENSLETAVLNTLWNPQDRSCSIVEIRMLWASVSARDEGVTLERIYDIADELEAKRLIYSLWPPPSNVRCVRLTEAGKQLLVSLGKIPL